MKRRIVNIDREKCNGCGACVNACHEGAIGLVDGKAMLLRDDYCDGLGDCLPHCPVDAISFVEREALEYNEDEVKKNMMKKMQEKMKKEGMCLETNTHSCPGTKSQVIKHEEVGVDDGMDYAPSCKVKSRLQQWPCQIKLAPVNAPWFQGAKLLIAADCTAYAYASFHEDFIKGKICLVGCPKLDDIDYSEKLGEIIARNDIKSVQIVRMEVPCCGGLENAAKIALKNSGKFIPWQVVTIGINGDILDN